VSLAERVEARVTPIAAPVNNRILVIDVERLPGLTLQRWWDRGDLQRGRYIHYETVERMPRTTIVCAKWYDSDEIIRLAEWDRGGRPMFLKRVHRLISEADILAGHNVDKADVPWLKNDLHVEGGLPPLPPFKTVDTLKILRKEFGGGMPFKGLDAANQILGLPAKTDRYDPDAMERAVNGSREDREQLTDYCAGDVLAGQWLYDWTRPHHKSHPALFVDGQSSLTTCHRCGAETKPTARRYVANVLTYSMRKCPNCKGYSRLSIEPERMSIVRGV
jgi:hypothetical protein